MEEENKLETSEQIQTEPPIEEATLPPIEDSGVEEELYEAPQVAPEHSDTWRRGFIEAQVIFDEASKSVGTQGSAYNPEDWKNLVNDIQSDNIVVKKRALAEIIKNPNLPYDAKLRLSDALVQLDSYTIRSGDVQQSSALITQRAYENAAMEDGIYESRAGTLEKTGTVRGQQYMELALSADSTRWLADLEKMEAANVPFEQMAFSFNKAVSDKSNLISWDTASLLTVVGGVTEMSRSYAMIADVGNPKLDKVLKRYSSDDFVDSKTSGTGRAGANVAYRTFLRNVSDVVAKEFTNEERVDMLKKFIGWINTPNKYTSGDGNWHIYAQVAQATLEQIINPKYNTATLKDVREAVAQQDGLGSKILAGVSRLADTPVGDEVAVFTQDLLAALSWFPVAAGIRAASKTAIAKIPNALPPSVSRLMVAKPRSLNVSLARAVQEDPEILQAAGLGNIDDLIAQALPSTKDLYTAAGAHPNIAPYMRETATMAAKVKQAIANISNNYVSMIPDERIVQGMRDYVGTKSISPWANMSAIRATDGVIEVSGTWGRTPEEGFESAAQASAALKRAFGSDVKVEPVLRNKVTQQLIRSTDDGYDELVKVAEKSDSYEWVASIDYKTSIDNWTNIPELIEETIVGQNMNWAERALKGGIVRNVFGKLFVSPMSWAEANVSNKMTWVAGNNRRFQEIIRKATEPFSDRLWQGEKDKVNAVILEQFNKGFDGTYTAADLIDKGLTSPKLQQAYWTFRALNDVAYEFADMNFAKSLRSQGYEDLVNVDGVRIGFVKPATLADVAGDYSGPVRIIEDGVDDIMQKNVSDIRNLIDKDDFVLYKMKQAEWFGNEEVLYTLIRKTDVDNHVFRIPDKGVLPRVAGYYTEIHQAPYAIYGISKTGRKHYIGTAENTDDALKAIGKVKAMPEYADRFAPETINFEAMQGYRDIITLAKKNDTPVENMGGIIFGHKSGDLKNFSGDLSIANKLDPLSSTVSMWSALGATYTKGRLIQHREAIGDKAARSWGLSADNNNRIVSADQLVSDSKLNAAQRQQLTHLKDWFATTDAYRIMPDLQAVFAGKRSRALASVWAAIASKVTGEGAFAQSLKEFAKRREAGRIRTAADPIDLSRVWTSFNHFRNIVMNPLKHMPMNLAQGLQNLAHVTGFAKAIRDYNGLVTAIVANDDALFSRLTTAERTASFARIAKEMGISKKELDSLVEAAVDGGVWNAAQHNYMHRQAARTQAELDALGSLDVSKRSDAAENIKDVIQAAYKTTRTLAEESGHALGENIANLSTFLTQYHYLKNTEGFDITKQSSKELLVGKTLALAGNMSAEWAIGLQRGFFKAPFQYSSFNLKMLHNILPQALGGSKVLTGMEKLVMFVSQAMVWGVDSVILGRQVIDQFENFFINDPNLSEEERAQRRQMYAEDTQFKRFIEHGFLGAAMNEMVHWNTLAALAPDDWEFQEDLDFGDQLSFGGGYGLPYEQMMATVSSVGLLAKGVTATLGGGGFLDDEYRNQLLQEALRAFGGSNQRTVLNIQQWVTNVYKVTGDAMEGRRPWTDSIMYATSETTRLAVGGLLDKDYWFKVSRQMGIEMQNGRPVGKQFRDTLASRLRFYTGLRLESEQDWQRLNDMMRDDALNNSLNPKDRSSKVQRKAQKYVNTMLNEIASFPNDTEGFNLTEQVLNKTNVEMAYVLSAMPVEDALELRTAIYAELEKAVSPKDTRREAALKLLGKLNPELHTEEGRKKLMKAAATSESYKNTTLGVGLMEFLERDRIKQNMEGSEE